MPPILSCQKVLLTSPVKQNFDFPWALPSDPKEFFWGALPSGPLAGDRVAHQTLCTLGGSASQRIRPPGRATGWQQQQLAVADGLQPAQSPPLGSLWSTHQHHGSAGGPPVALYKKATHPDEHRHHPNRRCCRSSSQSPSQMHLTRPPRWVVEARGARHCSSQKIRTSERKIRTSERTKDGWTRAPSTQNETLNLDSKSRPNKDKDFRLHSL